MEVQYVLMILKKKNLYFLQCSTDCGRGIKTRHVLCGKVDSQNNDTVVTSVSHENCNKTTKPESEIPCNGTKTCDIGVWFTGPWSEVSC